MTKVLIVDDVASELEYISRILHDMGITVVQARDGEEALDCIQNDLPNLLILDVIMPRMNGFEVVRELRDDDQTQKLPIILCTQKNTDIDKIWGMEIGADAYLTKPVEPQQLVNAVQRLLAR